MDKINQDEVLESFFKIAGIKILTKYFNQLVFNTTDTQDKNFLLVDIANEKQNFILEAKEGSFILTSINPLLQIIIPMDKNEKLTYTNN